MKECFFKLAPIILFVISVVIWLAAFLTCRLLGFVNILITSILVQLLLFIYCGVIIRKLHVLANTDSLTGICNRRCFFTWMSSIFKMKFPVSLMIIDIDYFKRINDTYGHLAGDEALKWFTRILKCNIRSTDKIARLGGEEFAVILPQTGCENALKIAERIKQAVDQETFVYGSVSGKFTISIGVATTYFPIDAESFLSYADKALYKAKETKNSIVSYEEIQVAAT